MKLADKPCYAAIGDSRSQNYLQEGLTFKERLVIALASNPAFVNMELSYDVCAEYMVLQTDAIIAELEKEK